MLPIRTNFTAPANIFFNQKTIMLYSFNQHKSSKDISFKVVNITEPIIVDLVLYEQYLLALSSKMPSDKLESFCGSMYYLFRLHKYFSARTLSDETIATYERKSKTELLRLYFTVGLENKKPTMTVLSNIEHCLAVPKEENSEYCFTMSKGYTLLKDMILFYKNKGKISSVNNLLSLTDFFNIKRTKNSTVHELLSKIENYLYDMSYSYRTKALNIIQQATIDANKLDVFGNVETRSDIEDFTRQNFDDYYSLPYSITPKLLAAPYQIATIDYIEKTVTNNNTEEKIKIPVMRYKKNVKLYSSFNEYCKANNLTQI